jgi:hypothetical protein
MEVILMRKRLVSAILAVIVAASTILLVPHQCTDSANKAAALTYPPWESAPVDYWYNEYSFAHTSLSYAINTARQLLAANEDIAPEIAKLELNAAIDRAWEFNRRFVRDFSQIAEHETALFFAMTDFQRAVNEVLNAPFVGEWRLGDVDGDGILSMRDAEHILFHIVDRPSIFDDPTNQNARYAAAILSNYHYGDQPSVMDAIQIIRRIEQAAIGEPRPSGLDDIWEDDEIDFGRTTEFTGRICLTEGYVFYHAETELQIDDLYALAFTSGANVVSSVLSYPSTQNITTSAQKSHFHSFTSRRFVEAGERFAFQRIFDDNIAIEDFVPTHIHGEGDLVWMLCDCEGCDPCRTCRNCESCGKLGGRFGFGRVTNDSAGLVAADAIAILRYILELPSVIGTCPDARAAASIIDPAAQNPTVHDAIAILRRLVELPSVLDEREQY